jgi:hypothetical protein
MNFGETSMPQTQQPTTQQTVPSIAPIDPQPIAQSESPAAVILAIAILISVVIGSITGLVQVIMLGMLHYSKPSR